MPTNENRPETTLKRSLNLPQLTLYGLGTTIGAGIYALIGVVATEAGMMTPLAFLVASALAAFSAFSFAEMAARFPRSAGEAVYVREGLGSDRFALLVGLMVVAAGAVSSATIINGFVGYFAHFTDLPDWLTISGLVVLLGLIAGWGIQQSVTVAVTITLIEIGGLLLVIWSGADSLGDLPQRWREMLPLGELTTVGQPEQADYAGQAGAVALWGSLFAGAFLAFYAFIGFEDMVNVVEEVKNPTRTMPAAIILTLVITILLYLLISSVAVLSLGPAQMGASKAPLALLYAHNSGRSATLISVIGVVAIVNGALIQIIMAARILYGLGAQRLLSGPIGQRLANVSTRTRTPLVATVVVTSIILALALWFDIATLARTTSLITLSIFTLVNLSLYLVKRRDPEPPGIATYPRWVPISGFIVSAAFLLGELARLALWQ